MEITITLSDEDLRVLKASSSKSVGDGNDRQALKRIIDSKSCAVDDLPLLQRVMKEPFRLHEFLERSKVQLPTPPKVERNPELEARCQRLRAQQANREYRDMTRNVDATTAKESSLGDIGREIRAVNRHLITLFNMLFTVVGSFIFAYVGTQYLYPTGPGAFASRLGAGLVTATVVFFADLYFVIKTLDEDTPDKKQGK